MLLVSRGSPSGKLFPSTDPHFPSAILRYDDKGKRARWIYDQRALKCKFKLFLLIAQPSFSSSPTTA